MGVTPDSGASTGHDQVAPCANCGAPLVADQRYCLACGRRASTVLADLRSVAFLDVLQADRSRETLAFGEHPRFDRSRETLAFGEHPRFDRSRETLAFGEHPRFDQQTAAVPILGAPSTAGYQPPLDPPGMLGSLRRYSGLFGLLGVLLAALLIGLLVGHWLTGSPGTGKQVFEVKGLSGLAAAAPVASTPAGAGAATGSGSTSSGGHHGASSGSGSSQSHNAAKSEGGVEENTAEEAEAAKEVKTTKALPAAHKTSSSTLQKLAHTTGRQHAKEVKAALGNGPIETH